MSYLQTMNKNLCFVLVLVFIILLSGCFFDSLPPPDLVAPVNSTLISDNPPEFIWNHVSGADYYWLQVSHTEDFSQLVLNVQCTADTVYTPVTAFRSGSYFWRVLGKESG